MLLLVEQLEVFVVKPIFLTPKSLQNPLLKSLQKLLHNPPLTKHLSYRVISHPERLKFNIHQYVTYLDLQNICEVIMLHIDFFLKGP